MNHTPPQPAVALRLAFRPMGPRHCPQKNGWMSRTICFASSHYTFVSHCFTITFIFQQILAVVVLLLVFVSPHPRRCFLVLVFFAFSCRCCCCCSCFCCSCCSCCCRCVFFVAAFFVVVVSQAFLGHHSPTSPPGQTNFPSIGAVSVAVGGWDLDVVQPCLWIGIELLVRGNSQPLKLAQVGRPLKHMKENKCQQWPTRNKTCEESPKGMFHSKK